MQADVIIGTNFGDEAKNKIAYSLLKSNHYNFSLKATGSHNGGHTIYHNDKKIVLHIIPTGVLFGIESWIGSACYLNPKLFFEELSELEKLGIDCNKLIRIDRNVGIITEEHLAEEVSESKIGTTRRGVGPAARDRYGRIGLQAHQIEKLKPFCFDLNETICKLVSHDSDILIECSQGHELDILLSNHYPYVTSSHCGIGGVIINGIPTQTIRKIYGAAKAYSTYLGKMSFQPPGEIFEKLQQIGKEIGGTTGRIRQCNYLNLTELKKSVILNGITDLIISKMDVLQQVDCWKIIKSKNSIEEIVDLKTEEEFKKIIEDEMTGTFVNKIQFSYSAKEI